MNKRIQLSTETGKTSVIVRETGEEARQYTSPTFSTLRRLEMLGHNRKYKVSFVASSLSIDVFIQRRIENGN